jgi:predicted TIM-barrel fold metal-dependent hydrolase
MIIDCHVHIAPQLTGFWQPLAYGRVRDQGRDVQAMPPAFHPPASPVEAVLGYMAQGGVQRAFLVQHHLYGNQNAAELDAVRRWPGRFYAFAYLGGLGARAQGPASDPHDPAGWPSAPDALAQLIAAGMTGLKVELPTTRRLRPEFRFDGPDEWAIWARLNELGRPLILDINGCSAEDVAAVSRLIEAFPRLNVAICHLGEAPRPGWQSRALLGRHPRVWIDLASVQSAFGPDHEYPFPKTQEMIRWALDEIGDQRLMWGTDYPGALNWATYRQLVDVVRRHCPFLSDTQRADILGGAAERFVGGA